jgi:hypothetical protein
MSDDWRAKCHGRPGSGPLQIMNKSKRKNQGAALIIVLAFVVLLTGLSLVYFSHTATDRQLAQASFHDTSAELLAHSALDIIVQCSTATLWRQRIHPKSNSPECARRRHTSTWCSKLGVHYQLRAS